MSLNIQSTFQQICVHHRFWLWYKVLVIQKPCLIFGQYMTKLLLRTIKQLLNNSGKSYLASKCLANLWVQNTRAHAKNMNKLFDLSRARQP